MSKGLSKESLAEKTRVYIDTHPSIKDCVLKVSSTIRPWHV